ncbi:MAG: hypothetical protein WCV52_02815 [Candidatus Paceibacterota bacterium]
MPTVHGSSQIFRYNFLLNTQFEFLYKIVLLVQLVGTIAFTFGWIRIRNTLKSKSIYWFILILGVFLSLMAFFTFYLLWAVGNMSFP